MINFNLGMCSLMYWILLCLHPYSKMNHDEPMNDFCGNSFFLSSNFRFENNELENFTHRSDCWNLYLYPANKTSFHVSWNHANKLSYVSVQILSIKERSQSLNEKLSNAIQINIVKRHYGHLLFVSYSFIFDLFFSWFNFPIQFDSFIWYDIFFLFSFHK